MKKQYLALFIFIIIVALIVVMPVSAKKDTVNKVGISASAPSVDRPLPFSVIILGRPNTVYYVWIMNTNAMDITLPDNAPPYISPGQAGVIEGNPSASAYTFMQGHGLTVGDVAYGHCVTPGVCYYSYAAVTTSSSGIIVVQFSTTPITKVQDYSLRVEQKNDFDMVAVAVI